MDKDTIEINSYLIRDSVLYTLLLFYFLFFLLFFICIIKFKSIKNCFFAQEKRLPHILPLYSTNKHTQFRYTDLKNHYDSSTEQTSDTDKDEDLFVCPSYKQLKNQLKDLKNTTKSTSAASTSPNIKESDQDFSTFQTTTSNQSQTDNQQPKFVKKKKRKCGLKSSKKCLNNNCKKKSYLSKLVCKYYDKFKPSSLEKTHSIDQSTDSNYTFTRSSKPFKTTSSTEGLNREKALKCYQDFIENRFTKPTKTNLFDKHSIEKNNQNEEDKDKREHLKRISKEVTNNATIMTPKQLKNYEPFKAEIANPIIKPKMVGKSLQKEATVDEPARENNLEDYNFLRLANEIEKQSENEPSKSPKFYSKILPSKLTKDDPKKSIKSLNLESSEDEDKYINEVSLAMNRQTIPDLNKMYKRDELKITPFEKDDKASNDSSLAKEVKKELDEIKEEKAKILGKHKEQNDKIDELNNKINELKESTAKLKDKEEIENLILDPPMKMVDKENSGRNFKNLKEKDDLNELMDDDSHENISPLVGRMKNEMKNLKPIEFKPLQTIYLKERTKPEELSEFKLTKIPATQKANTLKSSSPSLKSEQQLFSRNLSLKENNNLLNLKESNKLNNSESDQSTNDESNDKSTGYFGKLSLNNILNLKDKHIEEGSSTKLNIASIDRQESKDQLDKSVKLDKLDKSLIDKGKDQQEFQQSEKSSKPNATGKKSKIPTLKDKFKRSKSLTLQKKGLFNKGDFREDKVDKDLERMFNLKFKK